MTNRSLLEDFVEQRKRSVECSRIGLALQRLINRIKALGHVLKGPRPEGSVLSSLAVSSLGSR